MSREGTKNGRSCLGARLLIHLVWILPAFGAGVVAAQPGSGPRATVDNRFTTTQPGTATGLRYEAEYHAAGDPNGDPPPMRRMVVYPPRGMRHDTRVPARCTASDEELQLNGPAACPARSLIGRGNTTGVFEVPFSGGAEFHRYRHRMYMLNNKNEQIVLVESEGFTVVRGRIRPDGAIEFRNPTCFPPPPGGDCADDYIVQTGSTSNVKPYTRRIRGKVRSYATTPPHCPARGFWRTIVRFWWVDGTTDRVVTKQPCVAP